MARPLILERALRERDVDEYDVHAILNRLSDIPDRPRQRRVADRLLAIGWLGGGVASRSALALTAIEAALDDGDIVHARSLVPSLVSPADRYRLLASNAARPIWPDITAWPGERLEKQWPLYLDEARARWRTAHEPARGRNYADALQMAGADEPLIAEFAPVLAAATDRGASEQLVFVVPRLGWARVHAGRDDKAIATFDRALLIWPLGSEANALNVAANRSKYLLELACGAARPRQCARQPRTSPAGDRLPPAPKARRPLTGARKGNISHDPAVLTTLKPWGRILPFTLADSAPRPIAP